MIEKVPLRPNPVPVILDTDIGSDIDDTWALALALRCPELDVRLVTSATQDTLYRARLIARLLEVAGAAHIPIGIGLKSDQSDPWLQPQVSWVQGYEIEDYPGSVHRDGVGALIEAVMSSTTQVTIVGLGPLTNVAAALDHEPRIAGRARFVGMHGCLHHSHRPSGRVIAEYNVCADIGAAQKVFAAPWDKAIAPLDTCGCITLEGPMYHQVLESSDPLCQAVIENYRVWASDEHYHDQYDPQRGSSILFDTVAVYLAFDDAWLKMEDLSIGVTDDGMTQVDADGRVVRCATAWRDLTAFQHFLTKRLMANPDYSQLICKNGLRVF